MLLAYPAVGVDERCGCGLFFVVSGLFECAGHIGDDQVGAGVPEYDHLTHCAVGEEGIRYVAVPVFRGACVESGYFQGSCAIEARLWRCDDG